MLKTHGPKAPPAVSLRTLLLAASASLALAAIVAMPVQAAPPDSEGHEMTTDSPELAADRARSLQRVEQDRDAALQDREQQQRREDAAAAADQAASGQATTSTVNPLSGSTAVDPLPAPAPAAADPAPVLNHRANGETERSGPGTATNWSEDGKDIARSGSSSAGAPLSRAPAPGGVPGENAADPLAAPKPVTGEVPTTDAAQPSTPPADGGAAVIPEAARVDQ